MTRHTTDEQRWADLADLAVIISRDIQRGDRRAASLSPTERVLMRHLLRGDPATPGQLAAATGLLRPNVSAALRSLERSGLVEKQADPTDGRGFTIRPTALGRATYELERSEWATAVARAADQDTTDLEAAIAVLTKVKDGFARNRLAEPGGATRSVSIHAIPPRVDGVEAARQGAQA